MKVIFRKFKIGCEVIAYFPEYLGTDTPDTCMSYMHHGQHGSAYADPRCTTPAMHTEYARLLKELRAIGYTDLRIARRFTHKDYLVRRTKIEEVTK